MHVYPHYLSAMPFFRALGFGIFVVVLSTLLPNVLHQGEATVISILRAIEAGATASSNFSSVASPSLAPIFSPPLLPQVPDIRR